MLGCCGFPLCCMGGRLFVVGLSLWSFDYKGLVICILSWDLFDVINFGF